MSAKYAGLVVGSIQFSIFTACRFELSRITGTLQIQHSVYSIKVYFFGHQNIASLKSKVHIGSGVARYFGPRGK